MDAYVAALEAKLAEVSGIKINQIANAASEGAAIAEATTFIKNITIQKKITKSKSKKSMKKKHGKALSAVRNPLITKVLTSIKNETGEEGTFTLPKMGYEYNELEPTICEEIMRIHHSKHHNGYVNNINNAVAKLAEAEKAGDVNAMNQLTEAINFNGGGHINHTIFWTNMGPGCGGAPQGELASQINTDFGSFDAFKKELTSKSAAVKGSGWGWLGWNQAEGKLQVATCQNQDPLEATTGLIPLLGIDVWEHAYYIQYKNLRAAYVGKIFDVFNWNNVAERFAKAQK